MSRAILGNKGSHTAFLKFISLLLQTVSLDQKKLWGKYSRKGRQTEAHLEYLPDIDALTVWLVEYGSVALFILLALGIVALPVPEETLMVISGVLMASNVLHIPSTIVAAFLGSVTGITMSYLLGKTAGTYLLHRWGSWFGITEKRMEQAHYWFERFGKWTLVVGYFIPGVRHLTGFCAGMTELEYRTFAIYAYLGALLWVTTFLSIGYFFCDHCLHFFATLELTADDVIHIALAAIIILSLYLLFRWNGAKKRNG